MDNINFWILGITWAFGCLKSLASKDLQSACFCSSHEKNYHFVIYRSFRAQKLRKILFQDKWLMVIMNKAGRRV
jgi:hypothetical protein